MRLPKRQTWTIIICWTIRNSGFFCTAKLQQLLYSSKVTSKDWCTTTPGTNSTLSQLPELELTECRQIDWVIKVGFHSFIGEMEDGMYTCLPWQLQQGFTSLADLFRKKRIHFSCTFTIHPLKLSGINAYNKLQSYECAWDCSHRWSFNKWKASQTSETNFKKRK